MILMLLFNIKVIRTIDINILKSATQIKEAKIEIIWWYDYLYA